MVFQLIITIEKLLFYLFFSFLAAPTAYGSSRPGIKSKTQLEQHGNLNSLHVAGDETGASTETSGTINPLCHSGNSEKLIF